ncbi:hypothetical protein [Nocardia sp. NPDC051832]|uniref:hypothetical protein n=1 Tax=Nocardia sp. NPDC051832 TaxID=3155673 RepID=UPI003445F39E
MTTMTLLHPFRTRADEETAALCDEVRRRARSLHTRADLAAFIDDLLDAFTSVPPARTQTPGIDRSRVGRELVDTGALLSL